MVISYYVGFPFMKHFQAGLGFRMLCREPVPVQIKPVMIRSSARPVLSELPVVRIFICGMVNMHVAPACSSCEAIRIETWIDQDNRMIKNAFDLFILCCCEMVSCYHGSISRTRFVSVDTVS